MLHSHVRQSPNNDNEKMVNYLIMKCHSTRYVEMRLPIPQSQPIDVVPIQGLASCNQLMISRERIIIMHV